MRKIKINTWKAPVPPAQGGGEADENLLLALNVLIGMKNPNEIPKGLEKFRIFTKIANAFDDADKTGVLSLEDREYLFLKDLMDKEVPSSWAMNKPLRETIELFLDAKEE